ncbi:MULTISPECIES: hypothetical protein [Micromonospora]|uniref:Uncharacterized protein n=1 Tax=Verrucosispora sp. MS100047 TaxID=1410949 RepID=A0A097CS42_9ACTN|nr:MULTISPECIES: hypothetical protein [Micromonospora]AEB46073.1 hypothetical protein VAB18032_24875 [Micromonospora maris AB-18-032]AIS85469.1 hypothetical protein VASRM7_231 [Verrucosispora sp. MS100047]
MGRTVKIFALAATTAALVLFGASVAQADTTAPATATVVPSSPSPSPTATTAGNNPWD